MRFLCLNDSRKVNPKDHSRFVAFGGWSLDEDDYHTFYASDQRGRELPEFLRYGPFAGRRSHRERFWALLRGAAAPGAFGD